MADRGGLGLIMVHILKSLLLALLCAGLACAGSHSVQVSMVGQVPSCPSCVVDLHSATWPSTIAGEWDTTDTVALMTVVSGRLALTMNTNDTKEFIYIADTASLGQDVVEATAYFEWEPSTTSGYAVNSRQEITYARNDGIRPAWSLLITTDASGNLNGIRKDINNDANTLTYDVQTVSFSAQVYDFLIYWKKDTDTADTANNGTLKVRYRVHGSETWLTVGTDFTTLDTDASLDLDRVGVGHFNSNEVYGSSTFTWYWDNWSIKDEACDDCNY